MINLFRLQAHGHKVIRLTPYHCDLNPIELIWSQVKGEVARENTEFTVKSTLALTEKTLAAVSADDWKSCIDHVIKIEAQYRRTDGVQPALAKIVIPLDDSSSESSSSSNED